MVIVCGDCDGGMVMGCDDGNGVVMDVVIRTVWLWLCILWGAFWCHHHSHCLFQQELVRQVRVQVNRTQKAIMAGMCLDTVKQHTQ